MLADNEKAFHTHLGQKLHASLGLIQIVLNVTNAALPEEGEIIEWDFLGTENLFLDGHLSAFNGTISYYICIIVFTIVWFIFHKLMHISQRVSKSTEENARDMYCTVIENCKGDGWVDVELIWFYV